MGQAITSAPGKQAPWLLLLPNSGHIPLDADRLPEVTAIAHWRHPGADLRKPDLFEIAVVAVGIASMLMIVGLIAMAFQPAP
jgi:hypothetical protein